MCNVCCCRFSAFDADVAQEESRESTVSSFGSASSTSASASTSASTSITTALPNNTNSTISGGQQQMLRDKDHSDLTSRVKDKGSYTRSTLPKTRTSGTGVSTKMYFVLHVHTLYTCVLAGAIKKYGSSYYYNGDWTAFSHPGTVVGEIFAVKTFSSMSLTAEN